MGFLHKLWDETLAGPPPDNGLGKLRKYNSFSPARSSSTPVSSPPTTPVSRSITILRTNSTNARNVNVSAGSGSQPSSPAGSSTPGSPFSPTKPRGDFRRFPRKKLTSEASPPEEHRSPTGYDWFSLFFCLFQSLIFMRLANSVVDLANDPDFLEEERKIWIVLSALDR
ncbi:hypothetical protein RJ640_008365 [Escallonia rubra]|uniref:Dormancy-associated protein homolog 4 n=1 Tax=Escallonia rubra TaxID=112253 RepID=A0AA88QVE8_9ASTE|nr:hypothetical protein RJ640_008365 [Escallonia rubra]